MSWSMSRAGRGMSQLAKRAITAKRDHFWSFRPVWFISPGPRRGSGAGASISTGTGSVWRRGSWNAPTSFSMMKRRIGGAGGRAAAAGTRPCSAVPHPARSGKARTVPGTAACVLYGGAGLSRRCRASPGTALGNSRTYARTARCRSSAAQYQYPLFSGQMQAGPGVPRSGPGSGRNRTFSPHYAEPSAETLPARNRHANPGLPDFASTAACGESPALDSAFDRGNRGAVRLPRRKLFCPALPAPARLHSA